MAITRRQALVSAGAAALASSLAKPAIAAKEPIRMGYLPALTGPSSSTGIGVTRGVQLAVDEINASDGKLIKEAQISDAVPGATVQNGYAETTRRQQPPREFPPRGAVRVVTARRGGRSGVWALPLFLRWMDG